MWEGSRLPSSRRGLPNSTGYAFEYGRDMLAPKRQYKDGDKERGSDNNGGRTGHMPVSTYPTNMLPAVPRAPGVDAPRLMVGPRLRPAAGDDPIDRDPSAELNSWLRAIPSQALTLQVFKSLRQINQYVILSNAAIAVW